MTAVKIAGKPKSAATGALENLADWLYNHPGGRVVGVVEFVHTERTEPAPEEEKDRTVTLGISLLELATPEQEEALRRAARALFIQRTINGTLDPDGEVEMSDRMIREFGGDLNLQEAARLRAGVRVWAEKTRQAFQAGSLTGPELRHELQAVADGLRVLLLGRPDKEDV